MATSGGTGTDDSGGSEGTADETGNDSTAGNDTYDNLDERPCPDDSFLTYESFGGPFMLSYCTGCHHSRLPADQRQGAPIEANFDDLEAIRSWADRIWARAADDNATMPPIGAPGAEERARLGQWLACGAPTNDEINE